MSAVVADTHALVWYLLESKRLSPAALQALESASAAGETIFLASISLVEVRYLIEKDRLPGFLQQRLDSALDARDSALSIVPLDREIAGAMASIPRDLVPEMPDRIIAATAHSLGLSLVTRDLRLRATRLATIW